MSTIIEAKNLNLWYGAHHALHDVNIEIPEPRNHRPDRPLRPAASPPS